MLKKMLKDIGIAMMYTLKVMIGDIEEGEKIDFTKALIGVIYIGLSIILMFVITHPTAFAGYTFNI